MIKTKIYDKYKPSGVDWLGDVPEHWEVRKLKHISNVRPSNVDKKSVEGELSVQLCNYIDVYSNDHITSEINFMSATASQSQIKRFSLKHGDVLITKDSEAWDDIAVPAYITENFPGVLCGYHLAHISPNQEHIYGNYLFRAFSSFPIRDQFCVAANGITRFGLSKNSISSGLFLVPPLDEQQSIADFLDRRTGEIDELIAKKERVIELLREKRTALISHAVTKGLNPDVKMKDSGINWLGDVPKHWEIKGLRYLFRNLNCKRIPLSAEERGGLDKIYPYYGASGIIDYVDNFIFDEPLILVAEDGANLLSRSTPLAFLAEGKYWVNNHAHILRPYNGDIRYWEGLLQAFDYTPLVTGCAQPKLTAENLGGICLPSPPAEEQGQIANYLDRETSKIDALIAKVTEAIEKLKEYRTALTSAAVTGKIDIRERNDCKVINAKS